MIEGLPSLEGEAAWLGLARIIKLSIKLYSHCWSLNRDTPCVVGAHLLWLKACHHLKVSPLVLV